MEGVGRIRVLMFRRSSRLPTILWDVWRGSCGLLRTKMGPGRKLGIPGRLIIEEKQFLTGLNDLVLRWGCPMARGGQVDSPSLSAVRIKDIPI